MAEAASPSSSSTGAVARAGSASEPLESTENPAPERAEGGRGWYVAIALITLSRALAIALLPPLLLEAPALLIFISPAAADLVIAAPLLDPWLYFAAAMAGALVQSSVSYHFGRALGVHALTWLQSRSVAAKRSTARLLDWLERATTVVIMATPGVTVSALAGISGVTPRRYYPLMLLGNLLWTVACFVFGAALTDQLEALYLYVAAHVMELTAIAAVFVLLQLLWSRLRQRLAARRAGGD